MKDKERSEEVAANRMQLIAPLLTEGLDASKVMQLRKQIAQANGLSDRTIRRYLSRYQEGGYNNLKPRSKEHHGEKDAIPKAVLDQAILLRREVPGRSVAQIIQILEWEGVVLPGEIKRSTLQEKLAQKGYSMRHMRIYASSGTATRRFQRRQRNAMWHSDIKYGPYLPIGPDGKKKQIYLVAFLDDATRYLLHGEFYESLNASIVEDAFRKAILKYGLPDSVYFDNGKQFRNKWMTRACSKLGVQLIYARPYGPEATGKIERFNRVVDSFLSEVYLEKCRTLDEFNQLFAIWVDECYENKAHSGLEQNQSPATAYRNDPKPAKFVEPEVLANAFLHCESRKVDKAGCISFDGKKYEVGIVFTGYRVDVIFDPADKSFVTIEHDNHPPFTARELVIGEFTGKQPKRPDYMTPVPASESRLLTAAAIKNKERNETIHNAISYRTRETEGSTDV